MYRKEKKIKILHVIEDLETGGAERVLINLVLGLNRKNFSPFVCCLRKKGKMAEELEAQKISVFEMRKQHKIDLALLYRLQKFLRDQQIDIVHTHVFTANLWGRLAAFIEGIPVVISHEHSTFTIDHWFYRKIEKMLNLKTDCTVAVSQQLRNRLLNEAGLAHESVRTIYNGLPFTKNGVKNKNMQALRRSLGLEKFEQVVGSVGRFDPRKNYRLLLQAFAALLAQFPNAGLLLVGSGAEEANLKQFAKDLEISDRIIFTGHRNDVAKLLQLMSVFCLPSRTEGISMALLEAMAAKIPVVATRVGGNPEVIVDETSGLLVPPDDVLELTRALSVTLDNNGHSNKRALNAEKRVREVFCHSEMVRKIEALYKELFSGQVNGRRRFDVS
ncbi:MAG: glycosyltransferase [bacterium]